MRVAYELLLNKIEFVYSWNLLNMGTSSTDSTSQLKFVFPNTTCKLKSGWRIERIGVNVSLQFTVASLKPVHSWGCVT